MSVTPETSTTKPTVDLVNGMLGDGTPCQTVCVDFYPELKPEHITSNREEWMGVVVGKSISDLPDDVAEVVKRAIDTTIMIVAQKCANIAMHKFKHGQLNKVGEYYGELIAKEIHNLFCE